jgi:hypothetical protein
MLHTPVALILFNRPVTVERVFVEIAKAKPNKLFIIADGPREGHPEDIERCAAARAIMDRVDWDCEVFKNYSDVNLGCGRRPATGISWVFEHVDRAIILEDDSVPHPSFFPFCDELLEKYRHDERVMMVAGTNMFERPIPYSYCFTHSHANNGGWATWRRAWMHFDMEIKTWPLLRETSWLQDILEYPAAVEFWRGIFDMAYAARGQKDYWDYQWTYAVWAQKALAVRPKVNLISNIGFGPDATHTASTNDPRATARTTAMQFPLLHPPSVERHTEADRIVFSWMASKRAASGPRSRLWRKLSPLVPQSLKKQLRRLSSSVSHPGG